MTCEQYEHVAVAGYSACAQQCADGLVEVAIAVYAYIQ
jgi:hypothetical protein